MRIKSNHSNDGSEGMRTIHTNVNMLKFIMKFTCLTCRKLEQVIRSGRRLNHLVSVEVDFHSGYRVADKEGV